MKTFDVIVIGGGAAGLLCAGYAAQKGKRVALLEKKDRPGRKLLITGKGRCNVCNRCTEEEFISSVRNNNRFLYSAYNAFDAQATMDFFESRGVPLKTERGNRVFPVSDRAADIVEALTAFAKDSGAVLEQAECLSLLLENGEIRGVATDKGEYHAPSVVVATGGKSYPLTGSTGDGYRFAQEAGHTVTSLRPSLIPIVANEKWCSDLMGLSLKNVTLSLHQKGKKKPVFSELGEMLFTHFGISGPLVLSASAHMTGNIGDYTIAIDLKPGLSPEKLDARLLRDFGENTNRDFINALGDLLPRKLIPVAIKLSGIEFEKKVHQITKAQRQAFAALLKGLVITPKGFRPIEEAVVTAGGVKVSEVNPKTMESKLVKGLYFAGEVLDLDAYTGGFNLQIAFSTGYLAAMHV
ncbi:NAD(P)/FAD-dependent oxidoreductase [Ruminococcaceae bacterium OttesenSCG-928-L11]|nr:NAD(P)/FAD-dependent oxidoreductase [Ruminococcaceae bacterium OttesenSCG-928-L11]